VKPILVYIPTPDEHDAEMIGAALIKKKLAFCTNIIPGMHSQYIWKGKFQHEKEVILIAKTFDTKYNELAKTVKKLHCYELPCIAAIPITKINEEYKQWAKKQCT